MSKYSTTCECGNTKPPKQLGCDRCRSMEARSAFESKRNVGIRQVRMNLGALNAGCEAALVKRGLGTINFNKIR